MFSPHKASQDDFGFLFCQRLWTLTTHRDDIVVTDIEVHMMADIEVDKLADKVADMVADMFADIGYPSSSCQIGPKQTFPTRSLPDLRVF